MRIRESNQIFLKYLKSINFLAKTDNKIIDLFVVQIKLNVKVTIRLRYRTEFNYIERYSFGRMLQENRILLLNPVCLTSYQLFYCKLCSHCNQSKRKWETVELVYIYRSLCTVRTCTMMQCFWIRVNCSFKSYLKI